MVDSSDSETAASPILLLKQQANLLDRIKSANLLEYSNAKNAKTVNDELSLRIDTIANGQVQLIYSQIKVEKHHLVNRFQPSPHFHCIFASKSPVLDFEGRLQFKYNYLLSQFK